MPASPISRVLIDAEAIQTRVSELAAEITADYESDDPPILVGILKGCLYFLADLSRQIDLPIDIDLMSISSYGVSTESSGTVRTLKDLDEDIAGRNVLIVEDIVDTGLTLDYLLRSFHARSPLSVKVCALLDKADRRRVHVPVDYRGFTIPDAFVIGYGLDHDQRYRNLPYIGILDPANAPPVNQRPS